jgi:type I restriction enzyme, S subunit
MIPEGWDFMPLENIATVQRGKFSARPRNDPRYYDGTTPFIQTGDVASSNGRLECYTQTLNDEGVSVSKVFPAGTILVTIAANIGDIALTQFEVAIPDSIVAIKSNNNTDREWLFQYLVTQKKILDGFATQNAQKNINLQVLRPLQILVPPLPEQCKIAEILGAWDESIALLEKLIAAKRKLKQGLMQQLLTGKKRFKEFEGSEYAIKSLGEITKTFSGGTPSRSNIEYYSGNIPWIKSGELNTKNIWTTEERITQQALKNSSAKIVSPNTILVAMYGATAGVIGISRITAAINQAILAVVPNNLCVNDYIFYFLEYSMVEVIKKVQGGQPNLNAQIIKSSSIRLPPLPEQEKIAAVLSAADTEISNLEKKLAAYKQQKRGLMQQLLTGKTRVRVN